MRERETGEAMSNMLNLVRWNCGCVGLATADPAHAAIIDTCDADCAQSPGLCLIKRDMRGHCPTPLEAFSACEYTNQLCKQLADGGRFAEIRRLLNTGGGNHV